jgi:hypothetical protein
MKWPSTSKKSSRRVLLCPSTMRFREVTALSPLPNERRKALGKADGRTKTIANGV